jgi:hypothetical protein
MVAFLIALAATSAAQSETVLTSLTGGSDGAVPYGLIADSHGNLYGTNTEGASFNSHCSFSGCGNVFELSPNGSGGWTESMLYTFTGGSDGANPEDGFLTWCTHSRAARTAVCPLASAPILTAICLA